jgi:hypothetical protein
MRISLREPSPKLHEDARKYHVAQRRIKGRLIVEVRLNVRSVSVTNELAPIDLLRKLLVEHSSSESYSSCIYRSC